jgi:hypothetical protein
MQIEGLSLNIIQLALLAASMVQFRTIAIFAAGSEIDPISRTFFHHYSAARDGMMLFLLHSTRCNAVSVLALLRNYRAYLLARGPKLLSYIFIYPFNFSGTQLVRF